MFFIKILISLVKDTKSYKKYLEVYEYVLLAITFFFNTVKEMISPKRLVDTRFRILLDENQMASDSTGLKMFCVRTCQDISIKVLKEGKEYTIAYFDSGEYRYFYGLPVYTDKIIEIVVSNDITITDSTAIIKEKSFVNYNDILQEYL